MSPAVVNAVFLELKNRKSATYGGASLKVSPASIKKGTATVTLDESKSKYETIVRSEIVYTLTQLGLRNVQFEGTKGGVTRADIDRAAFRLTVPAWRALPPARVQPAIILTPNGEEMTAATFYEKIAKKDPAIESMARSYLASKDERVVLTTIASVSALNLAVDALLIPLLKDKRPTVRIAVIEALSGNEQTEVLDAISGVMDKDKDSSVSMRAASALGQSKKREYSVRALYFNLRGPDEAAAIEAVQALGESGEITATAEVVKAARGKSQKMALAAIEALGALKQSSELVRLFEDQKVDAERRLSAARITTTLGDEDSTFRAHRLHVVIAPPEVALSGLDALAAMETPQAREAIEGALKHAEIAVRHAAIRKLDTIGSPASLNPLAAAGTTAEDLELVEEVASRIMGTLELTDVLRSANGKALVLKRVAYRALGAKTEGSDSNRVFAVLGKGTASKDAGIRASSALALGSFQNDKALALIVELSKDADPKVRRNVARALANWPAATSTALLYDYLKDPDGEVVAAAVDTFRLRKEFEAYKPVLKLYRGKPHPFAGVRMAVLSALVVLAPEKELQTVISVVGGGLFDKEREVKLLSIELLGKYDNPAAVTTLAALINDPSEDLRVRSLIALGNTRSKDAIELIVSVMADQSPIVRAAAIEACGLSGQKACVEPVRTQLALEEDEQVLAAGKAALKKLK
jgi:HEAT repeat protein